MLVHHLRGHTILKDATSGKCLDINAAHLQVYGMKQSNELVGSTVWDVNNFMDKMWLDNARRVAKFDEEILHTAKPVIKPLRVWLNAQGMVWAHNMAKIPVTNNNKRVIAILGTSEDLTPTLELGKLYQYYCYFYQDRKMAIAKFLQHVGILDYFAIMPTHAEIKVLIAKKKFILNKLIAQYLNITEGTLESHINRINRKLKLSYHNVNNILLDMNIIP